MLELWLVSVLMLPKNKTMDPRRALSRGQGFTLDIMGEKKLWLFSAPKIK